MTPTHNRFAEADSSQRRKKKNPRCSTFPLKSKKPTFWHAVNCLLYCILALTKREKGSIVIRDPSRPQIPVEAAASSLFHLPISVENEASHVTS